GFDKPLSFCQFSTEEVEKFLKNLRKDEPNVKISYVLEKRLFTICLESRIRVETNRSLGSLVRGAHLNDLIVFDARINEKKSWTDPPSTGMPDATAISKNWVKGFELLEEWISLHVEPAHKIPLGCVIRDGAPDTILYNSADYVSLRDQYDRRCKISAATPWSSQCISKVWDILFAIFKEHAAYQHMKPFRRARDGQRVSCPQESLPRP
ncbi:MAG TPA: hypothetical protein VLS45_10465, partial [Methylomicrobium sp.]|nr:hypothetical protein [Methylomicrobium sp.]